jgi:hypothetical protein
LLPGLPIPIRLHSHRQCHRENTDRISSFEDRFFPASMVVSPADSTALQPLQRSALAAVETKVRAAQGLPRSRPPGAVLETRPESALAQLDRAARPEDRTLFQKRSDLMPGRIKLASLAPDGGFFRREPDLGSLGYDTSQQFTISRPCRLPTERINPRGALGHGQFEGRSGTFFGTQHRRYTAGRL